jgi:hypothetical protein
MLTYADVCCYRFINKTLACKDITERMTKDVRRDIIIEVVEELFVVITLPESSITNKSINIINSRKKNRHE